MNTSKVIKIAIGLTIIAMSSCWLKVTASESSANAKQSQAAKDGESIFRYLVDARGKQVKARISSGAIVSSPDFACQKCHGRSGLGTIEGQYVVPAIAGDILLRKKNDGSRKAYNQLSFFEAITQGIDSEGKKLDALMPRFELNQEQSTSLFRYLQMLKLTSADSVDSENIYFATVFSDQVPAAEKNAMQSVLNKYFSEKNRQTRLDSLRPNRGTTPESRLPTLYRNWKLVTWELKGDPKTWQYQLESFYQKRPVFSIISGRTLGSWKSVSGFCEINKIPCLFPSVSNLVASQDLDYSFFFNGGLLLEFDIAISHLIQRQENGITLVACQNDDLELQDQLIQKAKSRGVEASVKRLNCRGQMNEQTSRDKHPNWFVVSASAKLAQFAANLRDKSVYLSSALQPSVLSNGNRSQARNLFVVHSKLLPGKFDSALQRFKIWARTRRLALSHEQLQAEAYFACIALNDGIGHIKRYLVKDFLLDSLDHAEGLSLYTPLYPQPTLGPGQRFLSKGGYIIPVENGRLSTKMAKWILP